MMNSGQAPGKIFEVAAVIMAGGKGRRMGREKGLIELSGRSLVQRAAANAARVFAEVIISGPASLSAAGFPAVPDEQPDAGPLAGILAGLKAARAAWIMALPCDSPFVPETFLRGLAELRADNDVVVPRDGDLFEPLHALYSTRCIAPIERLIQKGERKIIALYDMVKVLEIGPETYRPWDPDKLAFFNINTPDDLNRAKTTIGHEEKRQDAKTAKTRG